MIAHTFLPQGEQLSSCASTGRTVPVDRAPVLAPNAEVFLYIHGMDSRLEEALDLTHALHALGKQRGKNYTVISMDLPTSGYADNIDYNAIAPLTADGHAGGGINLVDGLTFAPNKYNVPIVDFIEDFIVSFVNTLDRTTHVTQHPIYPIGGSLGGNMSFRLGRPRPDAPWITTVIPWSPAAIWPSFADNGPEHAALATSWYLAGGDPTYNQETPGSRRSFFYGGFDWASKIALVYEPSGGGKPQAYFWYREGWKCKPAHVKLARIDRYETYDQNFRRWHWRLGMEQLMFSQQNPVPGTNPPQPLYLANTKRMLLLCGMDDTGGNLCQETRDVAPKMEMTPGHALFLQTTGHSIHNERPNFLARQIADFVDSGPSHTTTASNGPGTSFTPPPPALTATVCATSDGKSCLAANARRTGSPLEDLVNVKTNGTPVPGATIIVLGQPTFTTVTDASGVALVKHLPCYAAGSQVSKIGQAAFPVRTPEPCVATVSKPGHISFNAALP
jgi:pimeloyl-ACP methyl ester carboxylesterase